MPWYVYLALKQLFPSKKRVSFYGITGILGVALGVMVLLIVQSVMNGFGEEIRSNIRASFGDVRIVSDSIIYDVDTVVEKAESHPWVEGASPFAGGPVMLQYQNLPEFPLVKGIDIEREAKVMDVDDLLIVGEFDDLDDETIFVGSSLAARLMVGKGSLVEVYTPLMLERMKHDEVLLPRELRVAGIFETGWNEIDSKTVMTSLRLMQELYGLENGVHGITLKLKSGVDAQAFADSLNGELPKGMYALSWMESQNDFLFIIGLEKTMMFFIMIFIVLVASFSIAIALMMNVVRKTREIGLLGAMGATPKQVASIFCWQGAWIGILGTAIGLLGAVTALNFRNQIVHTFARWTNSEEAFTVYYQFSNIPLHYSYMDFVIITIFAIVTCTFAGLLPALRVARIKPAEALRSE